MGLSWCRVVLKVLSPSSHAVVIASLTLLATILVLDVGYVQSLYGVYGYIVHKPVNSIVFTGYSVAPFTSVIVESSISKLLKGVKAERVIYEVLVPAYVKGKCVIVRGVNPVDLSMLSKYSVINGVEPSSECLACAWLGEELAKELRVNVGDVITIYTPFTRSPLTLKVKGILRIGDPYSREVIVPLSVGQALRGIRRGQASIAVAILPRSFNASILAKRVGISNVALVERALIAIKYLHRKVSVKAFTSPSEPYLARLGISRKVVIAMSLALALILSIGSYLIGQSLINLNMDRVRILYEQGLPISKIKLVSAALVTAYSLIALFIGYVAANAVSLITHLTVLNYPLRIELSSDLITASIIFLTAFNVIGSVTVRINEE